MSGLDSTLLRLASPPVPARLDMIDDAVMAGLVAHRQEASFGRRATGVAGAIALLVGVASGGVATGQPAQAQAISPFAPDNPLATSTLLDVHP